MTQADQGPKTLREITDPEALHTLEETKRAMLSFQSAMERGRLAGDWAGPLLAAVAEVLSAFDMLEAELDGPAPEGSIDAARVPE